MNQKELNTVARQQNLQIAVQVEAAEIVIAELMDKNIRISKVNIGSYNMPVIHVHYSPECQAYAQHPRGEIRCSAHNAIHTTVKIGSCLVGWDAPIHAAPVH